MRDIKAAMTPEEWAGPSCTREGVAMAAARGQPYLSAADEEDVHDGFDAGPEARHALAALALYGQAFGFTREDVEFLRYIAPFSPEKADYDGANELADRIEALLPPAPPEG